MPEGLLNSKALQSADAGPTAGHRRRFSAEEKRLLLTQADASGESMSSVGRRYGLSVSLLFRWRRQLADGTPLPRPKARDGAQVEVQRLRERVRELERLLGRATLETERIRSQLNGRSASAEDEARSGFRSMAREGTV